MRCARGSGSAGMPAPLAGVCADACGAAAITGQSRCRVQGRLRATWRSTNSCRTRSSAMISSNPRPSPPTSAHRLRGARLDGSLTQRLRLMPCCREIALGKISEVVREWIRSVTVNKGFSEQVAAEAGGKVYTLGSYRLGINQKGADIDTLILAPKHILREDFFNDLYNMLLARPEVTKLTKVPDAHTPIMNMIFSNVEVRVANATSASRTRSQRSSCRSTCCLRRSICRPSPTTSTCRTSTCCATWTTPASAA